MAVSEKAKGIWRKVAMVLVWISLTAHIFGFMTMTAFMLEESLQAQGFSYAIPMMSKEWESARACMMIQEPYMRKNIRLLKTWSRLPWMVGFRAYAEATELKMDSDKAFIAKMIAKERQEELLAMRGVK